MLNSSLYSFNNSPDYFFFLPQIEAFLAFAEIGGNDILAPEVCLLHASRCLADTRFTYRGATYRKYLWLSLKARSMLLQIRLKKKDSMALKHCKELHVLFHNNELPPTNDLRALQMQVCQLSYCTHNEMVHMLTGMSNRGDSSTKQQ